MKPVLRITPVKSLVINKYRTMALCALLSGPAVFSGTASATVIIDPLTAGATAVFPSALTSTPTTSKQITIGYSGLSGALEVNASSAGNGFSAVQGNYSGSIGAVIGLGSGSTGQLSVDGEGTFASFSTLGSVHVGFNGGSGSLDVRNGGFVETTRESTYSGSGVVIGNSGSTGDVTVDGPDSAMLTVDRIQVGAHDNSTGMLTVSNGGYVSSTNSDGTNLNFDGVVEVGDASNATGSVTVSGFGSYLETGGLIMGGAPGATALLRVENGAMAVANSFSDTSGNVSIGAGATVDITGSGSTLQVGPLPGGHFFKGREIDVGGSLADPGTLTVRDNGQVFADTIRVGSGGVLNGANGNLNANVVVDGGTLAPGNSPGTLWVDGDMALMSGILELEIGTLAMDQLFITGNLDIGPDLMISLSFGFDPIGYILDLGSFFNVAGLFGVDNNFSLANNLNVLGLSDMSSLTVSFFGDQQVYGSGGAGTSTAGPAPSPLALLALGLAGLGLVRRKA